MATNSTQVFATRLPEEQAGQTEAIRGRTGKTNSETRRWAVQHYLETDPDNLRRDDPTASVESLMADMVSNVPNGQPTLANGDDPEAVVRNLLAQASEDLEPISPERALDLYLEDKARTAGSRRSTPTGPGSGF